MGAGRLTASAEEKPRDYSLGDSGQQRLSGVPAAKNALALSKRRAMSAERTPGQIR